MRQITALAALVLLAACGDGGTEPVDPRVKAAGIYALTAVNNASLPALYDQDPDARIEFTGGTFTLRADGSYTESLMLRVTFTNGDPTQNVPLVENGTFTLVGSSATFSVPASGGNAGYSYTGAIADGVLSYTAGGFSLRYQK